MSNNDKKADIELNIEIDNKDISESELSKALDAAYANAKAKHMQNILADGGSCQPHHKTTFDKSSC
ncbi:hypothetical protein [Fulvimarina sp. MAC3]|uniref:hypothetical protein n=1 Tax=Fulvimarina sp. MAC3 TaxID=3148887 RepID=UPI0031FC667D